MIACRGTGVGLCFRVNVLYQTQPGEDTYYRPNNDNTRVTELWIFAHLLVQELPGKSNGLVPSGLPLFRRSTERCVRKVLGGEIEKCNEDLIAILLSKMLTARSEATTKESVN
jgi:hypothetical protein